MSRKATSLAVCAAAASVPALAQDSTPEGASIKLEVTGSRIARADAETALPVQVITAEEIRRAGWTTAAELIAHVPASFNGQNDPRSILNADGGSATANLRGLGDGNTLVLLNGRRLANYAYLSGAVDVSAIPLAALDRVEILKDGASSLYGTDAIAGVINFITRKDYRGAELAAHVAIPQHGGGEHYQVTASAGVGNLATDRVNAFVTVDWQKDERLRAVDRSFSRTSFRPDDGLVNVLPTAFPANIVVRPGRFANPTFASGCAPPTSFPYTATLFGNTNSGCFTDIAVFTDTVPAVESLNVVSRAAWQYAADHALFAEYLFSRRELEIRVAPTPVNRFLGANGLVARYPRSGPYYPADFAASLGLSGDLTLIYRTVPLGHRVTEIETEAHRLLVGGEGRLGAWDYNVAYIHSRITASDTYRGGWLYASKFADALATGLVNPWGDFGPEGRSLLEDAQAIGRVREAKATTDQLDARISGELGRLPAGPLAMAFGVEGRRESLVDRPAAILDSGDLMGGGSSIDPQQASRRVYAAFAEAVVPLWGALEAQLSARFDHYSDFGSTTNPKIALRWQPAKSLVLRASWGKGFRAPTLPNLFTPVSSSHGTSFVEDPERCPVTGAPEDCGFGEWDYLAGGNPALQPERSEQWAAGFVLEPARGASLAVDYWHVRKKNVISALNEQIVFDHYDVYGATNLVRGPVDPAYPDLPGPITAFIGWNQNVGNNETSGVDVSLRLASEPTRAGRFELALDGTYVIKWTEHLNGLPPQSVEGDYLFGPIPRWRHYAQLNWSFGAWSATLAQRLQSGYREADAIAAGSSRRVGSYSLVDVQAAYTGWRNATASVGIRNLFDRDPPFALAGSVGFDPTYADPRGRTFYARIAYAFR
jgi:iron complex outermembrane receptor protein